MTNHLKLMKDFHVTRFKRRTVLTGGGALGVLSLTGCNPSAYSIRGKGFDAEVLVLGAGLSGLHAARLLVLEGRDVLVLDGADRIGGRLQTLYHDTDNYTEAGGEQVGASYARILDTATDLGIGLIPDSPTRRGTAYRYLGQTYTAEQWSAMDPHPLKGDINLKTPISPLLALAMRDNPLSTSMDWRSERFKDYDISAKAYLESKGLHGDVLNLIGHTLNGNSLENYSMMNLYRSFQLYSQSRGMGDSMSIEGGAQRLPEAMANSLPRPVQTGHMIKRIDVEKECVTVMDVKGRAFKARHCISALPFGALRHVKINAPISGLQRTAINTLPYTQILQLHFKVETPYWAVDNLPANMWMDGPLERIFINHDAMGQPTNFGRAWINGDSANTLAGLSNLELEGLLKSELSKARSIKPENIELLQVKRWTRGNALSGGAYMHWAPEQIYKWANIMGQAAGALSFAGEHLSYLHTGLEGAMEAGENAAFALLGI